MRILIYAAHFSIYVILAIPAVCGASYSGNVDISIEKN